MARIFIDGFESQKWLVSAGGVWDIAIGAGFAVSTPGYGGVGYCYGSPNSGSKLGKYLPSAASYYVGFHFKLTGGNDRIFRFSNGAVILGVLHYNTTTGLFSVYKGDQATLLATGTIPVNPGDWCHIQIYYLPHATAGTFTVKVNGVQDINFSGSTAPSTSNIDKIDLYASGGGYYPYWDNVVVDDSAWPGVSRVAILSPSGAGFSAQWDPSVAPNYACVDEVPYSDTDFISTNVVDEVDTYAMSDLPSEAAVIKCVQVSARARKEGVATPQNLALAVRTTGGDYYSANQALQTEYQSHSKIWEQNPGTAAAWTVSEVNAMEGGVKSRT